MRFLANRIFEISPWVENFASLRHTAQYKICFSVSLEIRCSFPFLISSQIPGEIVKWHLIFKNLKCICIHRDGGCEWECGRAHIKLQHNYRISELEGTSATILIWCVQILQSQGLKDLSLIWGLPKTSNVILKSHVITLNLSIIFYKTKGFYQIISRDIPRVYKSIIH